MKEHNGCVPLKYSPDIRELIPIELSPVLSQPVGTEADPTSNVEVEPQAALDACCSDLMTRPHHRSVINVKYRRPLAESRPLSTDSDPKPQNQIQTLTNKA